jgi:uncharacterized membrane protein YciS (DUF1049 family)
METMRVATLCAVMFALGAVFGFVLCRISLITHL